MGVLKDFDCLIFGSGYETRIYFNEAAKNSEILINEEVLTQAEEENG